MRVTRSLSVLTACVAAAAAAAAAPVAVVHAQAAHDARGPVDRHAQVDALFSAWNDTTTPGCAVAISRDGALDYARGYGMANLEYGVAITPDSVFTVASVSKQFTALAIGLLAQEGKLSLEDDIRKHLPELPDSGHEVTIAQMLHHTAGLREEFHLMYLAGWRYDDPRTEADALRISAQQRTLNFVPGTEPLYSNSHYTLLGIVVHRVSGKPLRTFADERIFRPLGMTDTHFPDGHTESVRRRASGYRVSESGGWRISLPRSDYNGASNLLTTVGDLLKWEQNLIDARVGGRALVDWMQTSGTLNDGRAIGYGGGLRLGRYRGLRTIGHDGADAGYRADVVAFPDQRLTIAALCNGAPIMPEVLTRQIADVYLGDRMSASMPPIVDVPAPALSALAAYAGHYRSDEVDMTYTVRVDQGKLLVRWTRGMALALEAVGGDHFIDGIYTVTFTRSAAGEVDGLTISTRRVRRLRAERTQAISRSVAAQR